MTITKRIDNITGLTPAYAQTVVPPPKSVKIELTGRCNFSCSFCARGQRLRDTADMDRTLFSRLIKEMSEAGVKELGLFYLGESFMVPWLEDAVEEARPLFEYLFLTTNGSLAQPARVYLLAKNGLDSLKFSINFADESQAKDVARIGGRTYRAIINNIVAAKQSRDLAYQETGHRMGLYGSYIDYDGIQGARMAKVLDEVSPYLDEVYALPLYNQAALVTDNATGRKWEVTQGNRGRRDNMREPLPCWSIFTEGHVSWDGMLSACCFDHDGRFHMGDLTQEPFMHAWNSERFQALRAAHLEKNVLGTVCEACVAYSA